MKLTCSDLIKLISSQDDWLNTGFLAQCFSVSPRTIRNYIKKIRREYPELIQSSYRGYRINKNIAIENLDMTFANNNEERINYIIRRLLKVPYDVSVYDLADELYISDSTFENILQTMKTTLSDYNLSIDRKRNKIRISGSELDKRRLINTLIVNENSGGFLSSNDLNVLSSNVDISEIISELKRIFTRFDLHTNDYGFNTIVIHLIITIDRIKNGKLLPVSDEVQLSKIDKTMDYQVALAIEKLIEKLYQVTMSAAELYYLTLIISNNCTDLDYSFINPTNAINYIDDEYIKLTANAIQKLQQNYYLDAFDKDFIIKLAIHIRNLFTRARNRSYTKNPLASKIKNSYPLIYDMATFVVKEIRKHEAIRIVDDEIGFIAFHIGSYISSIEKNSQKIRCHIIYANYHDMHKNLIEAINNRFSSDISIVSISSIKDKIAVIPDIDLIISNHEIDLRSDAPIILVSPFINDADINLIRDAILNINTDRKKYMMRNSLNRFVGNNLFKKEFYCVDFPEMIEKLSDECVSLGLCAPSYKTEVLERESISSTSYNNGVAVPHSLTASAYKSFLSIVVNEKPIKWGKNMVNIIILIGICNDDRKIFRDFFDEFISILYEPINVIKLSGSNNYNDFLNRLIEMIVE